MFVMVDTVREMTVKKAGKYGEYESFDHLLFLLRFVFLGEGERVLLFFLLLLLFFRCFFFCCCCCLFCV